MSLKDDKQQNIQIELDFSSALTGEAREAGREETESSGAMNGTENPASTNRWMEEVCERENLKAAMRRVRANQGSPGVDGMTVIGIKDYLKQHGPAIREQLLNGTYEPKPVRRVEIRKPDGSGIRKLGIPTVLDRLIQQAVMQVLQRRWDRTFSDHSYGFRPGRSAHQAVARAQKYIAEGQGWCVDLDLEKFFDRDQRTSRGLRRYTAAPVPPLDEPTVLAGTHSCDRKTSGPTASAEPASPPAGSVDPAPWGYQACVSRFRPAYGFPPASPVSVRRSRSVVVPGWLARAASGNP